MNDDGLTLFAPASGFGRAAIAVVRISGPACASLLRALTGAVPKPKRLVLRALRDPVDGGLLDRALVVSMPGPATFTGEDMAELHLHGGLAVRTAVFRVLQAFPGCRPAKAGEFARRAVLNGRIGLTEAEGIADLIEAETDAQRSQALRQIDGALSRQVASWRDEAIDCLAQAEAALDFSDEQDVHDQDIAIGLRSRVDALRKAIAAILAEGRSGERLREGFVVVLAGPPNAGKSTLLNCLSRTDAAIVSAVPGTTRDAIEVRCDLEGLPVILVDTAGLRATNDVIEIEGIARTRRHMKRADLVLSLLPSDMSADAHVEAYPNALVVRTKSDIAPPHYRAVPVSALAVSALTGNGIEALLSAIAERAQTALEPGDSLVTRERHREALERCVVHLGRGAGAAAWNASRTGL